MPNFSHMTLSQLVAFYNEKSSKPVKKFSDRASAIRRCSELASEEPETLEVAAPDAPQAESATRPEMVASLKLDRTIVCVDTGESWANAYRMWFAHPSWMTSSQQDRLTAKLYGAAKRGEQLTVRINNRSFKLAHVEAVNV